MRPRRRAVAVALVASVAGYLVASESPSSSGGAADPAAHQLTGPIVVRSVDPVAPRGDGQLYELGPTGETTRAGRLACKRIHAARRSGLCLALGDNGVDYSGIVFDRDYRVRRSFPVDGVPDRARVSNDGRYGAYTSFDAAASQGYFESTSDFSTYTRIVDMDSGRTLQRLEDLVVMRDGQRMDTADAELWGVTFAGGDRYFATVAAEGEHYLIEGTVGSRRARVLHERVECPSVSPDGKRIAYKRRIGDSNRWRLAVLDLASGRSVALAERRSIDDQPEWLDDEQVAYSDDRDLFVVPADGSGAPERLAENATSPAPL